MLIFVYTQVYSITLKFKLEMSLKNYDYVLFAARTTCDEPYTKLLSFLLTNILLFINRKI